MSFFEDAARMAPLEFNVRAVAGAPEEIPGFFFCFSISVLVQLKKVERLEACEIFV